MVVLECHSVAIFWELNLVFVTVIVEEAAEAMEAHIVASLSVHCQHLILIGESFTFGDNPFMLKYIVTAS